MLSLEKREAMIYLAQWYTQCFSLTRSIWDEAVKCNALSQAVFLLYILGTRFFLSESRLKNVNAVLKTDDESYKK